MITENYCIDCKSVAQPDCDARGHIVGTLGQSSDDEPPAPRAGEREQWYGIPDEAGNYDIYKNSGSHRIARACSMMYMQQIITEHNQHATLIEQRDQLAKALKRMLDNFLPYSSENTEQYREEFEAYENAQLLLATIEQEGEGKSNTSGEAGR